MLDRKILCSNNLMRAEMKESECVVTVADN
jgi:hypothetical protein